MRDEFSTLDIVKALKIPRERLREWMNHGFIRPSVPAEGQGTKAVFTRLDVYKVYLFGELVNRGFKRSFAHKVISEMITDSWINKDIITVSHHRYPNGEKEDTTVMAYEKKEEVDLDFWWSWTENDNDPAPVWVHTEVVNFRAIKYFVDMALKVLD